MSTPRESTSNANDSLGVPGVYDPKRGSDSALFDEVYSDLVSARAQRIARELDNGNSAGAMSDLKQDAQRMSPQEYRRLIEETRMKDQDGVGLDLSAKKTTGDAMRSSAAEMLNDFEIVNQQLTLNKKMEISPNYEHTGVRRDR
jgi:hypothetical protein